MKSLTSSQAHYIKAIYELSTGIDDGVRVVDIAEKLNVSKASASLALTKLKGPSGRGKTTLGKILAGYIKPQKGMMIVNGKPHFPGTYNPVQLIYQHPEKAINPRWKLKKR